MYGNSAPLRVGIAGAGGNGSRFVPLYAANPSTEVVAVVDMVLDKARGAAAALGEQVHCYSDYREMLERETPDIVSVHSAPERSPQHRCAGGQVFCEKPLANTNDDCMRMAAERERPELTTACGHVLRMHPIFQAVHELIERGVLGDVICLEGDYIHDLRFQHDWHLQHERPVIGGGCHPSTSCSGGLVRSSRYKLWRTSDRFQRWKPTTALSPC